MFGKYADLILVALILGQATVICLLLLSRSATENRKILAAKNKKLEKENSTLKFVLPRLVKLVEQNRDDLEQRGKQIDQVNTYLGDVLGISDLVGFDREELTAADIVQELKEKIKWAEETRKVKEKSKDDPDYYNSK